MLLEKIKYSKNFKEILIEMFKRIKNEEEQELLEKMATIILEKAIGKEQIEELIRNSKKGSENMLAIVDALIEERKRERILGRKEGKKEGIMQVVKTMLLKNMPINLISEITEVSTEEIEKMIDKKH